MVSNRNEIPSLGEAAARFLATLPAEKREASRPEVYKFARWYGWDSSFSSMAPPSVAGYAEQLSASDTDLNEKLGMIRDFLAYGKKSGWSKTNLATHLKAKKAKTSAKPAAKAVQREVITLSQERYDELKQEMANLQERSQGLVKEIQRAAADKDFRENAPLAAAREERGYVEGRIMEIQETLKSTVVMEEKKAPTQKTGVGDTIVLTDLASEIECRYIIVHPQEVDVSRGKISIASPMGKALIGRREGDTVEITAPAGKLRYQIKQIEH